MKIEENLLLKCASLDDLIDKMSSDSSGNRLNFADIGTNEEFKKRFEFFKGYLSKELPDLTFDEIIKFDSYFNRLKDSLYQFSGFDYLLKALHYEQLKKLEDFGSTTTEL